MLRLQCATSKREGARKEELKHRLLPKDLTEERQIVWGSKDVEDVAILREGEVIVDGAEVGEDGGASGDEGVEDRHGSCRRSSEQISANPETETETETEKTKKKKKKEESLQVIN
jgi:hypothetical protein